ncbi:MAG: 4Fe-4S dicluster domain-containing protein [Nanoarchaeota archaeon]|nr:4Fe-4S dicluster domain-containing protein [Nanoarchaeota archaeon]
MGIMLECIKNFFKKPFTKRYPYVKAEVHERFRGRIIYKADVCIGCMQCSKNCPSEAITFYQKGKINFDLGECFNCGLCADICPVNAIEFSNEFEFADKNPKKLSNKVESGNRKI